MIILLLIVIGLCLGSFVNALVWRVYEGEALRAKISHGKGKKKLSKQNLEVLNSKLQARSITKGRSMCPHCGQQLAMKDLVPVLSWLQLRGRCRYCHKIIGWQYPVVELVTALLFMLSYLLWPLNFDGLGIASFVVWLLMLVGFMALLVYDIRWMILPNRILFPLIGLAVVYALARIVLHSGLIGLRDTIISVVIAGGLFYGLFQVSQGKWIGGGDVKLGFLIGLLLASPYLAFLVLFTASLTGTLFILPGMALKKLNAKSKIPFGPFLIIATIIVWFGGASFITWYKRLFLLG